MKGQIWYTDFILGLVIFTVAVIISLRFVTNSYLLQSGESEEITQASKYLSEMLMGKGIPEEWNRTNVIAIGIADDDHVMSADRLMEFHVLARENYTETKRILRINYDYLVFFRDRDGEVMNIDGACASGSPNAETGFNLTGAKIAYYYNDISFMRPRMEALNADIYDRADNVSLLFTNILNYDMVVMESPKLDDTALVTAAAVQKNLSDFLRNGGILVLDDEVNFDVANATYVISPDTHKEATVVYETSYLNLSLGRAITFEKNSYMNYTIATESYSVIASYADGKPAVSEWRLGSGRVVYFSDFDNSASDILNEVEYLARAGSAKTCTPISISREYQELAPLQRLIVHKDYRLNTTSEIAMMEVYLWHE